MFVASEGELVVTVNLPSMPWIIYRMLSYYRSSIVPELYLVDGLVLLDVIPNSLKYHDIAHCVI